MVDGLILEILIIKLKMRRKSMLGLDAVRSYGKLVVKLSSV